MLVCEAAGYDVILIETVGVGQSETMVADMTDCFLAIMLPGAGDELQGIKRGLLELVDVIAVNKADGETRAAAEVAAQQYRLALESLAGRSDQAAKVLTCSALEKTNVDAVWREIEHRQAKLTVCGELLESPPAPKRALVLVAGGRPFAARSAQSSRRTGNPQRVGAGRSIGRIAAGSGGAANSRGVRVDVIRKIRT